MENKKVTFVRSVGGKIDKMWKKVKSNKVINVINNKKLKIK